jgi:diguanylate cyclase (GGDEF)-like protein
MSVAKHALLLLTADPKMVAALQNLLDSDRNVVAVETPAAALAHAREEEPGLILLDVQAPGVEMGEFALKLKKDPRTSGIPLLLLAGSEEAAAAGLELGANDCLVYPLHPSVAKSRIRNYMDLGRCVEALRRFSLVDAVTGIANRRRFEEFLTLEWRRNLRNHTPLSLVLLDLDHFRAYIDQYGASTAEDTLKRISTAFVEAIQRPGDLVASFGMGSFACVLPETDNLGAVSVAERLRAELATLAIPHAGSDTESILTMSVGTATRIPSTSLDLDDLISLTEHALRSAKHAGRNRVMFGS